jgi:hypothetical protein
MELFGNSTYRFEQFDGMMALPFKYGNGYHMEGRIGVCDDESFLRLLHSLEPLINHGKPSIKIFVPPLPRYIFSGCCSLKSHSTNVGETDHSEKLLGNAVKFRTILKTALLNRGIDDFFVLDGVGSLIGIPPGENRGPVKTIVPELKNVTGKDGVHFTDTGYGNLCSAIMRAINDIQNGTLTKSKGHNEQLSGTAEASGSSRRKEVFFWRGFSSPVGAMLAARPPMEATNYTNQHSFGPGPILSERGSRVHGGNRGSHFPRARGRGGHGVRGGGGGGE